MIKNILVASAIGVAGFGAHANELSNGSFESNSLAGSQYCYGCGAADWNASALLVSAGSDAWNNPAKNEGSFQLGTTVAAIQNAGTLTSDFSFVVGQTYTLTWDDAGRSGYTDSHTYDVSAGGVTYAGFQTTMGEAWSVHTETFTATKSSALTFTGYLNGDATTFIDNVSVTAVPEPTSLLLMAAGTLGLLAWRRRAKV